MLLFRRTKPNRIDHSEAEKALQVAREAKDRVKSRANVVTTVSSSLRVAREKNHIAEGMHNILFGG